MNRKLKPNSVGLLIKAFITAMLYLSKPAFAAESYEDVVSCAASVTAVTQLDDKFKDRIEKLNDDEYNWLMKNLKIPASELSKGVKKFPSGTTSDVMLSSGKLSRPEWNAISNYASDIKNPIIQPALKRGQAACLKINKPQLAEIISVGATMARNQFNGMVNEVNQSIADTQQAAKEYQKQLESHPYYKSCPSFKQVRYSCGSAGDYDSCMKIRFGANYKNVQDSLICN